MDSRGAAARQGLITVIFVGLIMVAVMGWVTNTVINTLSLIHI